MHVLGVQGALARDRALLLHQNEVPTGSAGDTLRQSLCPAPTTASDGVDTPAALGVCHAQEAQSHNLSLPKLLAQQLEQIT